MANKAKKQVAKLTLRRKRFCELYATDREFFGNGVQSYGEAYDIDVSKKGGYNTAKVNAHKLLTSTNVLAYINDLLQVTLNEEHVDKQLAFLITQDADFGSKLGAIREYNALRQRITKKLDVSGQVTLAQAISGVVSGDSDNKQG